MAADELVIIRLASSGLNSPPPFGTGRWHLVGSSATAGTAWAGHSGELAEEIPDGGYRFIGKAHMPQFLYLYGGVLSSHTGSVMQTIPTGTTAAGTAMVQAATAAAQTALLLGTPPTDGNPYLATFTNDGISPTAVAFVAASDYVNP